MLENLPEGLGQALSHVRAGLDATVFHAVDLRQGMGAMALDSLAFADHAPLPARFTADGDAVSPPLHWSRAPTAAAEVVLIVEDADSPTPAPLVLAIAHALDPEGSLAEGALSGGDGAHAHVGLNSMLQAAWLAPDPPPGHGPHRYVFQVFALAPGTPLPPTPGRDALRAALVERGLASGCLIGTYERPSGAVSQPLTGPASAVGS